MTDSLLKILNLKTVFFAAEGTLSVLEGVNLSVRRGETLGIVGESGAGKSVTALSIMQLVPYPGRIVEGEIIFNGVDLLKKSPNEMRTIRGNQISMIFQEPMTSLNPVLTIGRQIIEPLLFHRNFSVKAALKEAIHLLHLCGISSAKQRINEYPHQLSGGIRQRVMIALALICKPHLVLADEPTSALDVTIQAQILALMRDLQKKFGMAIIFITHDIAVIAQIADQMTVMYAGEILESGSVMQVFDKAVHPYTVGLLASTPTLDQRQERLQVIEGTVPNPTEWPEGCRFHPRCPLAMDVCHIDSPDLVEIEAGHMVRCWLRKSIYMRKKGIFSARHAS